MQPPKQQQTKGKSSAPAKKKDTGGGASSGGKAKKKVMFNLVASTAESVGFRLDPSLFLSVYNFRIQVDDPASFNDRSK